MAEGEATMHVQDVASEEDNKNDSAGVPSGSSGVDNSVSSNANGGDGNDVPASGAVGESKQAADGPSAAGSMSGRSALMRSRPSLRNVLSTKGARASRVRVPLLSFAWRNRSVKATKKKHGETKVITILNNSCGTVRPGEMLAIMGPSGSGKTTLLNSLAGVPASGLTVEGDVLVGGRKPDASFRQRVSYVQQEDSLMGVLTVRETFQYAARLSGVSSAAEQKAMVDDTLTLLGLDVCADVRIGDMFFKGISGGQKRRVSVGVELMKQPSVIILDEPTSGLDSASAFHVIQALRNLAQSGRTIIATIHQPSSEVFAMFDKVCILTRGDTVYFGGQDLEAGVPMTQTMVNYFDQCGYPCPAFANAADHVLRLVNTDFDASERANIPALVELANTNIMPAVAAEVNTMDASHPTYMPSAAAQGQPDVNVKSTNVLTQFVVLSSRNWLNNLRNPGVFWIRMFMYSMLSFMIGTLFLGMGTEWSTVQDRIGILFYIAAFMVGCVCKCVCVRRFDV